MRISKKILACVLAALMAISMMPFTALADEEVPEGAVYSITNTAGNTTYYTTAFPSSLSSAGTYKLYTDVTFTLRMAPSSAIANCTIDLNGHNITSTAEDYVFLFGGKVTGTKNYNIINTSSTVSTINGQAATGIGFDKSNVNFTLGENIVFNNTNTGIVIGTGTSSTACKGSTVTINGTINAASEFGLTVNGTIQTANPAPAVIVNGAVNGSTAGIYAAGNADYTINGTVTGKTGIYQKGGDLVVNEGAVVTGTGAKGAYVENNSGMTSTGDAIVVEDNGSYALGTTTINGGTITSTAAGTSAVAEYDASSAASSAAEQDITVSGGTFVAADAKDDISEYLIEGATQDANGVVAQTYVAKIDDTYYETLNAALSAIAAGDTVTVLADTTLTTTDVNINKNITIDFGKYTVTAARWPFINNANLTLTGTTGGLLSSRGVIDNYGTLTVNGGVYTSTPTAQPAIWNNPNAETIINGGTISSNNAAVYNEGATVTINGGVLNSGSSSKANSVNYSYCVRNLPGSTCTMNGGTINAVHGGIAAYGNGVDDTTVVVNDGTITTHHSSLGNDAYYPLYISGNGTSMTVNGGTFSGPRTAAMIDDDDIGLTENTSLTITGGTFIAPTGVAAVTRGDNDSYPAISGGYFSTRVPGEFCADGYAANVEPNANGYYTVGATNDGANITVADEISQNFYLDDDFYGDNAYVAVTYNTNTNVDESATIGTEITAMSDLPVLASGDYSGNRIVSITQAPAQVTEDVVINVYASQADAEAGTNAVKTITYSTYDYCTSLIENYTGEKEEEVKNLAKATLDYAAAAQTYFNYNTDNMATADASGDFYNDVENTEFVNVSAPNFGGLFTSLTVVVKSDLEINLLTKTNFSYESYDYNPTKGGSRFGVSTHTNGGYKVLHIAGIEPANMDENITVYTSNGNVDITANAVMKILSRTGNANLATLAKAMYRYGQAAEAYFG